MADIINERVCAEAPQSMVLFLIGMRINRLRRIGSWLQVLRGMPRMLDELAARPELGLLAARAHFGLRNFMVVQYWQSTQHLQAYAHAPERLHLPAWQAYNRLVSAAGDVGIWHETYIVPQGHAESIYVNMPRFGLGCAAPLLPAKGERATAAKRLAAAADAHAR